MMITIKKIPLYWHLLFCGFFIFAASDCFYAYIFIDNKLFRITGVIGILCILTAYIHLPKSKPFKNGWKILFDFFLVINVITIFRGIYYPAIPYHRFVIESSFMWTYLMPFFLFLKPSPLFFRILFKWCWVYVGFALFFCLYNFSDFYLNAVEMMQSMIGWDGYYVNRPSLPNKFILPCCAFLFFYYNFTKKQKILLWCTFIFSLGASSMSGRRSSTAMVLCLVLTAFCYLFYKANHKIGIFVIGLSLVSFILCNIDWSFWEGKYEFLLSRIDSDSRSGTEQDFFKDFNSISDWAFGRGMSGTYLSPTVAALDRLHRILIETGYLNLILHGGLFLLIPYVLLMLRSVYKGLFSSHNLLCKAFAIYVGFHILFLYPGGTPNLSLEYLMVYMFIALCNSETWLKKTDEEIRQMNIFTNKKQWTHYLK